MNEILSRIASEILDLDTLETRNSDSLDFSEQAVWSIKAALEAAYRAGRARGELVTPGQIRSYETTLNGKRTLVTIPE